MTGFIKHNSKDNYVCKIEVNVLTMNLFKVMRSNFLTIYSRTTSHENAQMLTTQQIPTRESFHIHPEATPYIKYILENSTIV